MTTNLGLVMIKSSEISSQKERTLQWDPSIEMGTFPNKIHLGIRDILKV